MTGSISCEPRGTRKAGRQPRPASGFVLISAAIVRAILHQVAAHKICEDLPIQFRQRIVCHRPSLRTSDTDPVIDNSSSTCECDAAMRFSRVFARELVDAVTAEVAGSSPVVPVIDPKDLRINRPPSVTIKSESDKPDTAEFAGISLLPS